MTKKPIKIIVLATGVGIFSAVMAVVYAPGGRSVTRQFTGQKLVETEQEELWEQTQQLRAEGKYETALAKQLTGIPTSSRAQFVRNLLARTPN